MTPNSSSLCNVLVSQQPPGCTGRNPRRSLNSSSVHHQDPWCSHCWCHLAKKTGIYMWSRIHVDSDTYTVDLLGDHSHWLPAALWTWWWCPKWSDWASRDQTPCVSVAAACCRWWALSPCNLQFWFPSEDTEQARAKRDWPELWSTWAPQWGSSQLDEGYWPHCRASRGWSSPFLLTVSAGLSCSSAGDTRTAAAVAELELSCPLAAHVPSAPSRTPASNCTRHVQTPPLLRAAACDTRRTQSPAPPCERHCGSRGSTSTRVQAQKSTEVGWTCQEVESAPSGAGCSHRVQLGTPASLPEPPRGWWRCRGATRWPGDERGAAMPTESPPPTPSAAREHLIRSTFWTSLQMASQSLGQLCPIETKIHVYL